ncbi:cysteine desulfurase [Adhaeretor mobilis]|uniref:cysteine desulfurase n=1 Tax=Adhaeretor mobilis TaxID=1930276 RepID=A0A517MUL1_9BACT|nr:cysteine desulfurase [Adhaeretor mobilis]QDS98552.1 putative cysteine desulfurase [Adhaeretor mobilis]
MSNRLYFDNAATSWPKPDCVYATIDRYQREVGAAAGRGGYTAAVEAQRIVSAARRGCAKLLGARDPDRIVFTANGTDALNLAMHGILRKRDHVVTTVAEHNSVLRPLASAEEQLGVSVEFVNCDEQGYLDLKQLESTIDDSTDLVVVTHASNVTGALQPLKAIAAIVKNSRALLLVDAAQTAGHVSIDVEALGIDLLATSGHKGLLGPLGTGILYVREGIETRLNPTRQGGTGVDSQSKQQPDQMPERYEAGNLNVPAIAGLGAATEFLISEGTERIAAHEQELTKQLLTGLEAIPGVRVYGPPAGMSRVGVVSFTAEAYDPQELAAAVDAAASLQCRAGLHCAPRMHQAIGTHETGGTVRLSIGWATTPQQVEAALAVIAAVVGT